MNTGMADMLNIMCWNAEGIMAGTPYLLNCLDKYNIHICGISEHWLREHSMSFLDTFQPHDYVTIAKPVFEINPLMNRCNIRSGIALLIKKDCCRIQEIEIDSPRIVGAELLLNNNQTMYCFSVYMPASSRSIDVFRDTMELLESLYDVYSVKGQVIIIGDMNVKIKGPRYSFKSNDRSVLFQHFLDEASMYSLNVQSDCKGPVCTFYPQTGHSTAIDHIIMESSLSDLVLSCCVLEDDVLNLSEHHPVIASLLISNASLNDSPTLPIRYNWEKAKLNGSLLHYGGLLNSKLHELPVLGTGISAEDMISYNHAIEMAITDAASITLPQVIFKKYLKPYWNKELSNFHNSMLEMRRKWYDDGKPRGYDHPSYVEYKSIKRQFRKSLREAFDKYMSDQLNEIERSGEIDQKLFWNLYKKRKCRSKYIQTELKYEGTTYREPVSITGAWATHFENLFQEKTDDLFDEPFRHVIETKMEEIQANIHDEYDEYLSKPITASEVKQTCLKLKSNKAGGIDGLVYEHFKYGHSMLFVHLASLFNMVITTGQIPPAWKRGIIITLYKGNGKSKEDPNSYRGLTLLPVIFKNFEMLLSNRIDPVINSDKFPCKQQSAYQKGLCSLCTSFNLQECINYNLENDQCIHVAFLDSSKAFDTVWHAGLLVKLHDLGLKSKVWELLKNIYTDVQSCILFKGVYSRWITMERGILQGSALSAKMYLVFINGLLEDIEKSGRGSLIIDIRVNIPTQADDICILSPTYTDLQFMLNICEAYSRKWRFIFSSLKPKIVTFSTNRRIHNVSRPLYVYDKIVEEVNDITHVGIMLNSQGNSIERTLRACNKLRSGTMSLVRSGVHPSLLNPLTACKFIKSIVYPSALYGCELWSLSKTEILMLERAQHFIVKSIQGFENKTRTDKCTGLLGWTSIEGYINIRKLLFLGRLCRLDTSSLSFKVFITRLLMVEFNTSNTSLGFLTGATGLLKIYGLYQILQNFIKTCNFPSKKQWNAIVKHAVMCYEENKWKERMLCDTDDFFRFSLIHNKLKPHYLWKLAQKFPTHREAIQHILKLAVTIRNMRTQNLCHKCGQFYTDTLTHIVLNCIACESVRDQLWCSIINISDIMFSVYLHSLDDQDLIHILLGGCIAYELCKTDYEDFMLSSVLLLYKMIRQYYK